MAGAGSSLWKSKGAKWIGLGWTGFILENSILSHNRNEIIYNFGDQTYHNVYNTLSTIACSSIAWGYFKHGRQSGPKLAGRSKAAIAIGFISQSIGLICLSQLGPKLQLPVSLIAPESTPQLKSNQQNEVDRSQEANKKYSMRIRCPMDFKAVDAPADGVYGLERISRHCVFWSFGMVCLGQACYTLFIPEIVMFGFPMIFALIGTEHQDYRFRRGSGGVLTSEYEAITSNIPFAALITGKQSWEKLLDETKWVNAGVALCLTGIKLMRVVR